MIDRGIRFYFSAVMVGVVAAIALLFVLSSNTFAQAANGGAANVLKLSPVRTDIEVQPGSSRAIKVTVTNLTKQSITVRPISNDFVSGDERGTPALILDEDDFAPTHSLKRFIAPLSEVTIPAEQAKILNVIITVPKEAQAGGYFGAIRFVPTSPNNGAQVNVNGSVASLILLKVPGDIVEKLTLTDFSIQQVGKSASMFLNPRNLQTTMRFENKGNVQIGPFGKISVTSGDKVIYEADFNPKDPRDMVLPDSARRWEIPIDKIGEFGKYTVKATFTYGQKNQTVEATRSFWVIPQKVIIVVISGVVIAVGLIISTYLFIRKRRSLGGRRNSPDSWRV